LFFCHPDEASIASGWKDLGQRGVSTAGSGFELLLSNENLNACATGSEWSASRRERCAISETGTGSACALLSEIRSSRR
jgi:hypothetical protein